MTRVHWVYHFRQICHNFCQICHNFHHVCITALVLGLFWDLAIFRILQTESNLYRWWLFSGSSFIFTNGAKKLPLASFAASPISQTCPAPSHRQKTEVSPRKTEPCWCRLHKTKPRYLNENLQNQIPPHSPKREEVDRYRPPPPKIKKNYNNNDNPTNSNFSGKHLFGDNVEPSLVFLAIVPQVIV